MHGGAVEGYRLKIQAVERNFLDSVDKKYFMVGEYLDDPYNTGKSYKPDELIDMMYDIEPYSEYEQEFDPHKIIPGSPIAEEKIKLSVINLLAPEGLRGNAFRDTGEL